MKTGKSHIEETETAAQLIKKAGKETPFMVPESYFDILPSRIMKKVQTNQGAQSENWFFAFLFRPGYAVSLLMLAFLFVFIYQQPGKKKVINNMVTEDVIPDTTLFLLSETYVLSHFEEDDLVSYLIENSPDLTTDVKEMAITDVLEDTSLTRAGIIDYLIENNDLDSELLFE